jgi:hypothetical protein
MNLWMYSFDLNISSCFKISDIQVILFEISETGLRYFLARTGVGWLVPACCCCCCTCSHSLIHGLDLLGVYYPTAGSSRCSPQARSPRPDPISRQSARPATEAYRAQFSPQRSSCETAENSFAGNRLTASQIPEEQTNQQCQ